MKPGCCDRCESDLGGGAARALDCLSRAQGLCGRSSRLRRSVAGCPNRSQRSMNVVAASVIVTALAGDSDDCDRARGRLRGERLAAPDLIDLEVVSAWRPSEPGSSAGGVGESPNLAALRIERAPHQPLIRRCWALRSNLTDYNASYVALAEALDPVL